MDGVIRTRVRFGITLFGQIVGNFTKVGEDLESTRGMNAERKGTARRCGSLPRIAATGFVRILVVADPARARQKHNARMPEGQAPAPSARAGGMPAFKPCDLAESARFFGSGAGGASVPDGFRLRRG